MWISNNYLNFWLKFTLGGLDKNTNGMVYNRALSNQYRIYRDGVFIKEIQYTFQTHFIDTEFTKESDVEYCVTAVYGDEESEPVCVTATITGVSESGNEEITISPNPANDIVRIDGAKVADVKVYNVLGQLVKTAPNANTFSVAGLPTGLYLLHMTDGDGMTVTKRIVVK